MYANNEIGTIEPLADIAKVVRKHRKERVISRGVDALPLVFHTDASQVPLFLNCTPTSLGVDLMTLDGQKMYGPKGIGLLYKKDSVVLEPLLHGGSQEQGLRPGTEPVALIIGLTEALSYAISECEETASTVGSLRDYFIEQLVKEIPNVLVNGDREKRIASNINVSIPNISGAYFVVLLDSKGIACGTRSACIGDSDEASYVLEALGRNKDQAKSSLRFSLGRETSKEEIDQVIQVLKELVAKFDN